MNKMILATLQAQNDPQKGCRQHRNCNINICINIFFFTISLTLKLWIFKIVLEHINRKCMQYTCPFFHCTNLKYV